MQFEENKKEENFSDINNRLFTPSVVGSTPFPLSAEKRMPNDLAEEINFSTIPAGSTLMIVDSENSSILKQITNKFLLTGFSMNFKEKAQLIETFGASFVAFFNDSLKIYQFTGRAVDHPSASNAANGMHQSSLTKLYNEHLRGTKLIENNQIGVLKVFNHLIYGYPLNFNVSYNGAADKLSSFNMS